MAPAPSFDLAHLKRAAADLVGKLPPLPELPIDLPPLPAFVVEALEAPLARPAAAAILVVAATLLAFTIASRKGKAVRGSVYVRGAGGETVRRSSRARVTAAKFEESTPVKKTLTSARKAPAKTPSSTIRRSTRTPAKK